MSFFLLPKLPPPSHSPCHLSPKKERNQPFPPPDIPLGSAHIIRNAGGSSHEALRSVIISQQLLGTTEILVIKHTGCGMLTFDNAAAYGVVEKNLGGGAAAELRERKLDFLTFPELDGAVAGDVDFLKGSKLVGEGTAVSGWVYEVETGKTRRVV